MGLKERYLEAVAATDATYMRDVGTQLPYEPNNTDAGAARGGNGVNFMDGTPRSQGSTRPPDEYQTEFTRNLPGSYVGGGAQAPTIAASTTLNSDAGAQTNTRWKNDAFKLAFGNKGPSKLPNGYYITSFRQAKSSKGTVGTIHNYIPSNVYTPATTGGYINQFDKARDKYNASSTSR